VKKKLIEVALPLEAISAASAHEKAIRRGHPFSIHQWWSRKPLATCRAVLFAQIVDDPSANPEKFPTEEARAAERARLFRIIEQLVKWENTNDEKVLNEAREEILKSTGGDPPPVFDPFCGGGSIPLEALRLGLEGRGSDLNPVAVLGSKALIEIPAKFRGSRPVNPSARELRAEREWSGVQGLAEDVRFYGKWIHDEAARRVGRLFPKIGLPEEEGGGEATVVAWLYCRTVTCPNPACGAVMPLASKYLLRRNKEGNTWIQPLADKRNNDVRFEIRKGVGAPPEPPKTGRGAKFKCFTCGQPSEEQYVKDEGKAGRIGTRLMAIAAEGKKGRIYLPPDERHIKTAESPAPAWKPEQELSGDKRAIWCRLYGLDSFDKLFTPRQITALNIFTDLVGEARERVRTDAAAAGMIDDRVPLDGGGTGATAYADAVATYLALAVSKTTNRANALSVWGTSVECPVNLFSRQTLPMTWDFAESNVVSGPSGSFSSMLSDTIGALTAGDIPGARAGRAVLKDAATAEADGCIISTDPPYYDNIGYADISDFFYVWLRRSLAPVFPSLFSTMLAPKSEELVATPHRFGGSRIKARDFFEAGLGKAFARMREAAHPDYPLTIYYAFKQSGTETGGEKKNVSSTGWETMLEGLLGAGFVITGTWPVRSERQVRSRSLGSNALTSSIVLVCRRREPGAPVATRKEFLGELKRNLPGALRALQLGNIAPVDLAQAAIGPGMAVFSRYEKVLEADGEPMRVRTALQVVNMELDSFLAEQDGDLDRDTRFCVAWFE